VFIRSLLLSLERLSAKRTYSALYATGSSRSSSVRRWTNFNDASSRNYLTHTWWDTATRSLLADVTSDEIDSNENEREPDWFVPSEVIQLISPASTGLSTLASSLEECRSSFSWMFAPAGDLLMHRASVPNTVDRLSWFLAVNQARLLRELLLVVDFGNINHENICCLNTAVVIAVFAHRRRQLSFLLQELRLMNDEENEAKRRALDAAKRNDVVDRALSQVMSYLDFDAVSDTAFGSRRTSYMNANAVRGSQERGDQSDVLRNFREVLWFWIEYYSHRGRDRLSLEFSSHIRFYEWYQVVAILTADDGSPTSLVRSPVRLPLSPYHKAARVSDNPVRGE
jgi:Protein of unknown function (DUF3689)